MAKLSPNTKADKIQNRSEQHSEILVMQAYSYLAHRPEEFPVCNQYKDEILSLPMFPELTHQQIEYVAEQIRLFYKREHS